MENPFIRVGGAQKIKKGEQTSRNIFTRSISKYNNTMNVDYVGSGKILFNVKSTVPRTKLRTRLNNQP